MNFTYEIIRYQNFSYVRRLSLLKLTWWATTCTLRCCATKYYR